MIVVSKYTSFNKVRSPLFEVFSFLYPWKKSLNKHTYMEVDILPDWSYHPLFKPWLSQLPNSLGREFIHRGMNFLSSLPGGPKIIEFLGHMTPSTQLKREFLGLSLANPIGLSGKVDPLLTGTRAFSNLGFGFLEVGSVSVSPRTDQKATFDKHSNHVLYPNRLESIGLKKTIERLKMLQPLNKPIFIRLEKSRDLKELFSLLEPLVSFGDAIIIEDILSENEFVQIKRRFDCLNILLSVSQEEIGIRLTDIVNLTKLKLIDGLVIEESFQRDEEAQFSTPNQTTDLIAALKKLKEKELASLPTIVSGGIVVPKDALLLLQNGADLVMLSSGYVESGPGLPKRINEALLDQESPKSTHPSWIWYWLFGLLIVIGGCLALAFSMTVVILPYDETFLQLTREQLFALNPNIINFMAHDRMTLAGTMISGGILYMQLARHGVRYGIHWARKAINLAGIIGFLGILLFIGYGYFDWLHGLFWIILFPVFYLGWKKTREIRETSSSRNRGNHSAWKKGLRGQLAFVTLGFSFVLGGIVIATIGVTNVFVSTDLLYICMTPEQLNEVTGRLIPLIAHDRAGFGGALVSVGLLVLTLALWGFHQGEKWVWYTFLFGGIPAFSAGILTHFVIGYTTFIHLVPAYIALIIYLTGLVLSKDFLHEKRRI
jgi:dihydroorotate dehydrogenase